MDGKGTAVDVALAGALGDIAVSFADNPDAYIAGDRRRALAEGVTLPDRVAGSALFVDISGFTPLTEALANELGPQRGAEEVTAALNLVFDGVLGELHRFGGSVIYFSGDAVTCWLDGDDGLLAVNCGLRMQDAMARVATFTTPGGRCVTLGMKVAVAAGRARRFVVGDPDVQLIDVLAGSLMDRLAAAEHHAERGDVVVDRATLERLRGRVEVSEVRGDGTGGVGVVRRADGPTEALPEARPYRELPHSVARQWLLPAVYERMRTGRGEFLAELRPAVPVFVRFGGIDYDDDPDAHVRLDDFIRRAQWVIDSHGGNTLQLTLGDKGAYLYAVFGSPLAHEDDASRACAAALDLLALEGETAVTDLQIGIAGGRLRSGTYGHHQRRTFCCLGDAVNLAARLMSAAPAGEAYVSAQVANDAGGSFRFERLADLAVKGKSAPIAVCRLAARTSRVAARRERPVHPLVGRVAELQRLLALADTAAEGHGQVVALAAEAGMGKSRLAAELVDRLAGEGIPVYAGQAASEGSAISYLAWQGVWTALLGFTDDADPVTQLEASLASADPALVPRLPLLGAVLGIALDDNELTGSLDPKLRKASLESLLVRYLACRAEAGPLVVVIEDCHWLDPLSVDLLELIARAVAALPVLVVLTFRPGPFSAPDLGHTTLLALERLDDDSCWALLGSRFAELYGADAPIPTALLERLVERAEGNPFYLEELVSYLHDQGADPADPAAASVELPTSLAALVLSRIDTLGESSRRTLKVASVVGRDFSIDALTGAYPDLGARGQVAGHLRRLCAEDLVLHEGTGSAAYAFKHAVIREVAYDSLPFAMRALLHGQLGLWVEATDPAALDLLAHHFWNSRQEDKKLEYLQRAGEAAEGRYANAAAVDYYRRLLTLLPDERRGPMLLRLGAVLELRGEWGEAEEVYTEALFVAERLDDADAKAWAHTNRAEPMRKQGRYPDADAELDLAWETFEALGDEAGLGRVAHIRGLIANLQGDPDAAWSNFERSLEIRRKIGDAKSEATVLGNLAMPAAHRGDYELAEQLSRQALDLRVAMGDRWGIGVSLNNLGMLAYLRGDFVEARAHLQEALRAGLEVGDLYGIAISQHNLGNATRELEDIPAARDHYGEALRIYSLTGDRWSQCMLFDDLAMMSARREPRDALRLVGASDGLRETLGSPRLDYQESELDTALVPARTALGPQADAERAAGRAVDAEAAVALALSLCGQ